MLQHKEQQGFLTFARNSDTVDYLHLAYVQALNIKATQRIHSYAVVVDNKTNELITDEHRRVFDYVIVHDSASPFAAEAHAFWLTPFKETIKLESDLLFTRSIDHWWTAFRLKDICLSTGCRDYKQNISTSRKYREIHDANQLPDVYTGLMYFRFSQAAALFFKTAKQLQEHWSTISTALKQCIETTPSTDVLFALAAQVVGEETCTMPSMNYINFVHMKPSINGFAELFDFQDTFVTEFDQGMIRINNINQYHPVHYYCKTFATKEMIDYYGSRIS
jgi:hypothetical protein